MLVVAASLLAQAYHHATFGRAASLALCRSFASQRSDTLDVESLVRGRLALEDARSFGVLGHDDDDDNLVLFVCSAVDKDVHKLDACVWPLGCDKSAAIRALRHYHARTFGKSCVLAAGALGTADADVWNGADV
jgi:hypothetical protein